MQATLKCDPSRLLADLTGCFGSRDDLLKAMSDLEWMHAELGRVDDPVTLFEDLTAGQSRIQTMLMGALWMSDLISVDGEEAP